MLPCVTPYWRTWTCHPADNITIGKWTGYHKQIPPQHTKPSGPKREVEGKNGDRHNNGDKSEAGGGDHDKNAPQQISGSSPGGKVGEKNEAICDIPKNGKNGRTHCQDMWTMHRYEKRWIISASPWQSGHSTFNNGGTASRHGGADPNDSWSGLPAICGGPI